VGKNAVIDGRDLTVDTGHTHLSVTAAGLRSCVKVEVGGIRVLDESQEFKFSYRVIKFSKTNILSGSYKSC